MKSQLIQSLKQIETPIDSTENQNSVEQKQNQIAAELEMDDFSLSKFNPSGKTLEYDEVAIAKKLTKLNPKTESLSDLQGCIDFANRLVIFKIDNKLGVEVLEKIASYLSTLTPNQENTKLYIQCVSVWGKLIECEQMQKWLNSKANEQELANVFAPYLIDKVANSTLDFVKASQPAGWGAHILYPSKFAVDFMVEANDIINSPVDGEVVEVHSSPYDLNTKIIEYVESCKAGNVDLTRDGILENMLITDQEVAENTLKLTTDYIKSGANSLNEYIAIHKPGFQRADGVSIKDGEGNIHTMLHAQATVKVGDSVKQGDQIAQLRYNSGMADALHVHYEANEPGGRSIPIRNNTAGGASLYTDNLPGLDRYVEFLGANEA